MLLGAGHAGSEDIENGRALVAIYQDPTVLIENDSEDTNRWLADAGEDPLATKGGEVPGANRGLGSDRIGRIRIHGSRTFLVTLIHSVNFRVCQQITVCQSRAIFFGLCRKGFYFNDLGGLDGSGEVGGRGWVGGSQSKIVQIMRLCKGVYNFVRDAHAGAWILPT